MSLNEKSERMCRVCLSTNERYSELFSLFSGGCAASEVPKKMMNIGNIKVHEEDGLPSMICQKCLFLVKVTDCFKKQLQVSDRALRKICTGDEDNEEGTLDLKLAVDSSDSEIEDLAYNPEYISDEVKAEVEKAFKKKHEMRRKKEYGDMLKLIQNLGKKRYNPIVPIKKETIEIERSDDYIENDIPEFDTRDSVENGNSSNDKINESIESSTIDSEMHRVDIKIENTETIKIEDSVLDMTRKTLQSEESAVLNNPETLEAKNGNVFNETEAIKSFQLAAERNMDVENVDPNIIVISDTSDEEDAKISDKTSHKYIQGSSELCLKRKKKKTTAPLLKKAIVSGTPRIQVKKVYQTLQVVKTRKTQSKTGPRTYFLCTSCNVRLKSVADVLLHHNEVHSPNKNCPHCRMCNKTFPTKLELLAHFDEHVETHLFRCSYCPNEFVLKDNLTRHMLSHTEEQSAEPEIKRMKTNNENLIEEKKVMEMEIGFAYGDNDSGKENEFTSNS